MADFSPSREPAPPQELAAAFVAAALASVPGRAACDVCEGPLVEGESSRCRGCADEGPLDAAVEADLEPGPHGEPAKPRFDTPLDA